jgi:hypothetical protein
MTEPHDRMPTILISYDVHSPNRKEYYELVSSIQSLGSWWHHLETIWIVKCDQTPAGIRDRLKSYIATDDQLLVIDISGDTAECFGVNDAGSAWLKSNV